MRLQCRGITFKFPLAEHHVFKDLSFELTEPGFHALFGPSGVGKTSMARILTGDLDGYRGQVRFESIDSVLYSYNLERLPGWSSVGRHLQQVTPAVKDSLLTELIRTFKIGEVTKSKFGQLSLGQKNRVNLVRYLLQEFQVLIMDESLANVDEKTRESILLAIKDMFPDVYFLYISHNVMEVAKFCKSIVVLRSPDKRPQATTVFGIDHRTGHRMDSARLDQTMLEIMNAA
jgi:ABC-type multidrug transport system ATPase subunit